MRIISVIFSSIKPCTNQLFPIVSNYELKELSKIFHFYVQVKIREDENVIRLVTSWATKQKNVDRLIECLAQLPK